MPDWFTSHAPTASAAQPSGGGWFDLYDPARKPASSEDFTADTTPQGSALGRFASGVGRVLDPRPLLSALSDAQRGTFGGDPEAAMRSLARVKDLAGAHLDQFAKAKADAGHGRISEAIGHSAAGLLPLVGPAAAHAGETIASGDVAGGLGEAAGLVAPIAGARAVPPVAGGLATIGEQLISKGKAVPPIALELASHLPVIGGPLRLVTTGRKILGRLLDLANPETPNAGGRLVKGVGPNIDHALADALEELRRPETPDSVELPPPAELPPGYEPRTSVPALAPPNIGGRLVPQKAPNTAQALADVLAELQRPPPPTRVTTAPEASLPPGYTPRTSGPRLVPRSSPVVDTPAAMPKRAYFLKPEAETTATLPSSRPPAAIDVSDLPTSWRARTGSEPIPPQGQAGNHLADAFADELRARGLSAKDAIAMVTKNPSLPPPIRLQIIAALKQAGRAQ